MSNQIILWATFIVPWLTLFFLKKEDIKRYMPAALISIVLSTIVVDAGVRLGFWVIQETVFPLHVMLPYMYGLYPVATIWILKYTSGSFLIYMLTNAVLDLGFSYLFLEYFIAIRGIAVFGITGFQDWLLALGRAIIIYVYQKWQEGEPIQLKIFNFSPQAVTKPLTKDEKEKDNNR